MSADWALVAARSVHLAAILQAAGAVLALAWIARDADDAARAGLRRLTGAACWLGALSALVWLVLQTRAMSGHGADLATLGTVLTGTRFGYAMLARAFAMAVFALLLARDHGDGLLPPAAVMTASLAWGGHAAAGLLAHLAADILHLLAAAAWLGGLLPLAMVLRRGGAPALAAVERFGMLGMAAVGTLIATGVANAVFLVGWLPGLIGTPHGQLLLVKLALFAGLLGFAAYNRLVLTPRGASGLVPLARSALAEGALALALLAVVGALGTLPPGAHAEPRWPFPWRLEQTWPPVVVPATPLSFARPATPYTAAAVVEGNHLYAAHCAGCHADGLKTSTPGDLYWWATQGHAQAVLPAGAEAWSIVHALRGRTAAALTPEVGPPPGLPAPDFDYDTAAGEQGSLYEDEPGRPTLLVFFDDAKGSRQRLNQLSMRRPAMEAKGVRILAIDLASPRNPAESDLAVAVAPEMVEAYRLLVPGAPGHTEMLVDRAGAIRAVWRPDDVLDWRAAKLLSRQIDTLIVEAIGPHRHH